jgi:hypothetical protein
VDHILAYMGHEEGGFSVAGSAGDIDALVSKVVGNDGAHVLRSSQILDDWFGGNGSGLMI